MFTKYFIVETADNVPYDVTEVTEKYGREYLRAVKNNEFVREHFIREGKEEDISFIKWSGEYVNNEYGPHVVEYCLSLIKVEN